MCKGVIYVWLLSYVFRSSKKSMKKGIVYCIHLAGVGHMKRMLTLCEGLLTFAEITFVQGGPEVNMTIKNPNFHHIKLPITPEMSNPSQIIKNKNLFAESIKTMTTRKKHLFLQADLSAHYDFVIVEQLPFSKLFWINEVIAMIEAVKTINPKALIISSHKGTTREENKFLSLKDQFMYKGCDERTLFYLKKYFDVIMVHSDPRIIKIDDNFYKKDEIADKIFYTGFVSKSCEKTLIPNRRDKHILITVGSGLKFSLILNELLDCISNLSEYTFTVIKGPMMQMSQIKILNEAEKKLKNLSTLDFVENLNNELLKHSLVIAMAGFTLINICNTKTPALIIPDDKDGSQKFLARKFAEKNFIRTMSFEDFKPDRLRFLIEETLKNPPKFNLEIDTSGVEKAVNFIKKKLLIK